MEALTVVLLCASALYVQAAVIPGGSCYMDFLGVVLASGATFIDRYGCYSCMCANGQLNCTNHDPCIGRREVALSCTGPNGQEYTSGQSFKDADNCNTCTCYNGMIACTEMACLRGCYDATVGVLRQSGTTFLAADGCNTCSCTQTYELICTEKACIPGK